MGSAAYEASKPAMLAWRKRNPDKVKAHYKNWIEKHPAQYRLSTFKADLKKLYGLSLEDWDEMVIRQAGRCGNPGCNVQMTKAKEPHVDHAHVPNYRKLPQHEKKMLVRGLLCGRCNTGIGQFDDDEKKLAGAIQYLTQHKR